MKIMPDPVQEPTFNVTVTLTELRIIRALVECVNSTGLWTGRCVDMSKCIAPVTKHSKRVTVQNIGPHTSLKLMEDEEVFGE